MPRRRSSRRRFEERTRGLERVHGARARQAGNSAPTMQGRRLAPSRRHWKTACRCRRARRPPCRSTISVRRVGNIDGRAGRLRAPLAFNSATADRDLIGVAGANRHSLRLRRRAYPQSPVRCRACLRAQRHFFLSNPSSIDVSSVSLFGQSARIVAACEDLSRSLRGSRRLPAVIFGRRRERGLAARSTGRALLGRRALPNASTCRPSRRRTMANSNTVSKASAIDVAAAAPWPPKRGTSAMQSTRFMTKASA